MDNADNSRAPDIARAESSTTAMQRQSPICVICQTNTVIYTCPRCSLRTCSLTCSTQHKTLGKGCSGIRNKAAYVPMNQYGYMSLMSDYTFLEEMGRKVMDWGKEITHGGYTAGHGTPAGRGGRGRGRGRGRGGAGASANGKRASKRDVLKMQLDFRDIEVEFLPNGMERRTLNQSTWDFKNRTALLTIEWRFHPPRNLLAAPSRPPDPPFTLLTHKTTLETLVLSAMQTHISERGKSKKDKGAIPAWVHSLVFPDEDVPDAFTPPLCVMSTPLDPLAALNSNPHVPQPGRLLRSGYYKLDAGKPVGAVLKHKHFVEFPTIEVWEEDAFQGTIVDDRGTVLHDAHYEHRPKRRKMNPKQAKQAMSGLLGGYGSDEEDGVVGEEERNVMDLLGGYADSEGDSDVGGEGEPALPDGVANDEDWGDEDAEGETDDEYEGSPEELAAMLQKLREAGALRDPGRDSALAGYGAPDEEQVDWGDSGDEDFGG